MKLRSCLFLSAVAVSVIVGCNNRDPLAPYAFLNGTCADMPPGTQGMNYNYQPDFTGGATPYSWEAVGLPPGLEIDPDTGLISGIPLESGSYNVVIIVTDANGRRTEVACGSFEVQEADELMLNCEMFDVAVQGTFYTFTPTATGGTPPFTWMATGLPADLDIDPNTGEISGDVTADPGIYPITVTVTDSSDPPATAECMTNLEVAPGLSVDPMPLEDLDAYPDNCVPANSGIDIDQLIADGIVVGGDGTPITCSFEAVNNPEFPPGTGRQGHGNLPPGITVNEDCTAVGTVSVSELHGMYVWIATLTQEGTGQKAYVPYCAPQQQQPAGDYEITVTQAGDSNAKFTPGYTTINGLNVNFGDGSDPLFEVERPCVNKCAHKFRFEYNALPGGAVGANSTPIDTGGFSHGVTINASDVASNLEERFWVANIHWWYCIFDSAIPGNDEYDQAFDNFCGDENDEGGMLLKQNGEGSLEFGVIVRPQ